MKLTKKILVATFTNGLWKGKFLFSLYKNDLKTMLDVLYRATKYMNAEDVLLAREGRPKKRERQEDSDRIEGGRWQELESEGMTGTLSPLRGGSQASPH